MTFISAGLDAAKFAARLGSRRTFLAVRKTRGLTRADLWLNKSTAAIEIDPRTGEVTLDGKPLGVAPATDLPLSRRHFLR
jgi:urease subunit alpha